MDFNDDVAVFGRLVRERRKALQWTQEALAAAALNNLDRKSMISQIENGKIPNITRETVKRVAQALSIDVEDIPASLRWSEAAEVVKDTNAVVHQVQAATEKLVELLSPQALGFKIKEGMLIALAHRYAEGSPTDFDAAYAGLERALEIAAEEREKGKLPTNVDDAVSAFISQVDKLNEEGRLDAASALLVEEEARAQAGLIRLYNKGIAQAVLTRDVDLAAAYEIKKLPLEATEPEASYAYLRGVFAEWYTRGSQRGLKFDVEVAVSLMRHMVNRFHDDQDRKGGCLTNLGVALRTLGERESGNGRLEEAVAIFIAALKETPRDSKPHEWALTQLNLGNTLLTLGQRESGIERLEEAVAAYRAALMENTRDKAPRDWAMTQMNLGNALLGLGQRENSVERLEEAVAAYRAALEERSRDQVPLEWAMTQANLGIALKVLGELESSPERLEEAVAAYRAALKEQTRDRVPLQWATIQTNLGLALMYAGEQNRDKETLQEAVVAFQAALEERSRDQVPLEWANCIGGEAAVLSILAELTADRSLAVAALDKLVEAEGVLREGDQASWADFYAGRIAISEALLEKLIDS